MGGGGAGTPREGIQDNEQDTPLDASLDLLSKLQDIANSSKKSDDDQQSSETFTQSAAQTSEGITDSSIADISTAEKILKSMIDSANNLPHQAVYDEELEGLD